MVCILMIILPIPLMLGDTLKPIKRCIDQIKTMWNGK